MGRRGIERNNHHGFYPRRYYEDSGEPYLAEARHRIIYKNLMVANHVALHKAVEPPPFLTVSEAADLLDAFDLEEPERGIESFEFAEDYFAMQAIDSYFEEQERMFTFANNFARQLVFLKGNYHG